MRSVRITFLMLLGVFLFSSAGPLTLAEQAHSDGSNGSSSRTQLTENMLIGDWKDTPGGYTGNFYCFYSDGGFIYIFDISWDALDPRVNMEGTWKLDGDALAISISSLVTHENGVLNYDQATGYHFEGGNLVTYPLSTELVKEYAVGSLCEEKTESDEYYERPFRSKWTMILSRPSECLQLWKYSDWPYPRNEAEEAAYDEAIDAICDW